MGITGPTRGVLKSRISRLTLCYVTVCLRITHLPGRTEVYWSARRRSQTHRDLMCVVCDSYDKSKLMIPKYPYNRTPKRPIYETIKRVLKRFCQSTFCKLLRMNGFFQIVPFIRPKPHRLRSFSDAHMCDRTRPWLFPIPL